MTNISVKHQPIRFDRYREIHDTVIEQYKARDFIGESTLGFQPFAGGFFLTGEIGCLGQIVITVEKFLEILEGFGDTAIVMTEEYAYNASIRGHGNIFRYDNQHSRPDHPDSHHKHIFDWRLSCDGEGQVEWIGVGKWPTLGDAIGEAEVWYWTNQGSLPNPDLYPAIGLRCQKPSLVFMVFLVEPTLTCSGLVEVHLVGQSW